MIEQHFHCKHCGLILKEIYRIPPKDFKEQVIYTCGEHFFVDFIGGDTKEMKIIWSES